MLCLTHDFIFSDSCFVPEVRIYLAGLTALLTWIGGIEKAQHTRGTWRGSQSHSISTHVVMVLFVRLQPFTQNPEAQPLSNSSYSPNSESVAPMKPFESFTRPWNPRNPAQHSSILLALKRESGNIIPVYVYIYIYVYTFVYALLGTSKLCSFRIYAAKCPTLSQGFARRQATLHKTW